MQHKTSLKEGAASFYPVGQRTNGTCYEAQKRAAAEFVYDCTCGGRKDQEICRKGKRPFSSVRIADMSLRNGWDNVRDAGSGILL